MRAPAPTILLSAFLLQGCASGGAPPGPAPESTSPEVESILVPAGYGTLLQDQISLRLQSGDLLIKITPLDEAITRPSPRVTSSSSAQFAHARKLPKTTNSVIRKMAVDRGGP